MAARWIRTAHFRFVLGVAVATAAGQPPSDPAASVASLARSGNLVEAGRVVDEWLAAFPRDLDALAWHARIAGWRGRYCDAEREFSALLQQEPDNPDLLIGLASVWNARKLHGQALALLERACPDAAARPDCGIQKARTLFEAGRETEARNVCGKLSGEPSASADCRKLLAEIREDGRLRLAIGSRGDRMSFADNSMALWQSLGYRFGRRWDAELGMTELRRFGQTAQALDLAVTFRAARRTAIAAAFGSAGKQDLAPRASARLTVDQGFTIARSGPVRAVEAIYQQGSIAYSSARVLTFSPGVLAYLPREWDCLIQLTGAKLRWRQDAANWTLSGMARVSFPVGRRVRGSIPAGGGPENLGTVERLLFRSSSAAGAGVTVKLGAGREWRAGTHYQQIAGGRSILGYESALGFRF